MTAVDFFLLDLKVRSTIFLAALVVFALGVLVGRLARALPEPPLREAPRPAEACVEEWLPINEEDEALVNSLVAKVQRVERRRPFVSPGLAEASEDEPS